MTKQAPKLSKKPVKSRENLPKTGENSHELVSISALSRMFNIDRATVRTRIENAGIQAAQVAANEKLYLLDDRLEAIVKQDELEAAKLRKLELEADLKEHDLQVKKGEYASVAEFTEITQKIFGRLYKKLAVQLPARIAGRLHNANSSAELAQLLKTEIGKEFDALRSDFTKYL